jgi:hypothetical protein
VRINYSTHWPRVSILIDEVTERGAVGRSYVDAPEVDGKVYLFDEYDVKTPVQF